MNDEEVLREIMYLDPNPGAETRRALSSQQMVALMRDAIQIEMAKQGHLRRSEDVSERISSLEERLSMMRREFIRQQETPSVIYVRGYIRPEDASAIPLTQPKLPTAMIVFYGLGLGCSLMFATFLALSALKVETIHPFISLLGLVGGLGWLTTAWTDLLLWKREKPIGYRTTKSAKSHTVAA